MESWRRGWDSHHCRLLKTKKLPDFSFRTIRQIRTKAGVEPRIEHAELEAELLRRHQRSTAIAVDHNRQAVSFVAEHRLMDSVRRS